MSFAYTNSRGQTYVLHRRNAALANGQTRVLHYFSRTAGPSAIDAVPAGYTVVEAKTGLPLLKRT
ncbi:MAG: hypothetical protein FJ038_06320 [Chloroflexi bacterium]|nr:hypothetical protein [Chloroflexota bacterium]